MLVDPIASRNTMGAAYRRADPMVVSVDGQLDRHGLFSASSRHARRSRKIASNIGRATARVNAVEDGFVPRSW
jgi:hypothetical protein